MRNLFEFLIKEVHATSTLKEPDKKSRLDCLIRMCAQELEAKYLIIISSKSNTTTAKQFNAHDCATFLLKEIKTAINNPNTDMPSLLDFLSLSAQMSIDMHYLSIIKKMSTHKKLEEATPTNNRESALAKIEHIHREMHTLIQLYKIPISDRKASFKYRKMSFLRIIMANPEPAKQIFTNIEQTANCQQSWLDAFDQQFDELSNLTDDVAVAMIGSMTAEQKLGFQDFVANTKSTISKAYHVFDFIELLDAMTNNPMHLYGISFPKGLETMHPLAMFIVMNRARNLIAHGDVLNSLIEKNPRMKQLYTAQ